MDVQDLVVRLGIRFFIATIAQPPYITTKHQSHTISVDTSVIVAPIVCTRINAGTALLLGNTLPMMCSHSGNASVGSDAPLSRSVGIDVHIMLIIAASGRLNSVERAIANSIAESIYGTITEIIAAKVPFVG